MSEESVILVVAASIAVSAFALLGCCIVCMGGSTRRRQIERGRLDAPPLVPVAMIAPDGSSRMLKGVVAGRRVATMAPERQSLLYG
jgi:hypothetical protein